MTAAVPRVRRRLARSRLGPPVRRARRLLGWRPNRPERELVQLTAEDRRYLTSLYDDSVPIPASAADELRPNHPYLRELRAAYAGLELPVISGSRWRPGAVESFLDLRYFRGETLFVWHYRELPRITQLKYFIFARYVEERTGGVLEKLSEDGAFGCWTFSYPGYGRYSRDLLESANEIAFLERELQLSRRERLSVLDIGAGYGRLAHRMTEAFPNLTDYCCVDAVPEATFLSEFYLRYRGATPPARTVRLDRIDESLDGASFDIAVNVHSFSECPIAAIEWWIDRVASLRVPYLFIVPNEPHEFLSLEADKSRRDFLPVLERAGYRLIKREPVLADPAVQELIRLDDHFHLFALTT